jgi:nucleoporin NUP82
MPTFLERQRHGKYKRLFQEPVRLSPATLTILTDAHKVISEETHRIGTAAAELFRRCEKLQADLKNHIHKAHDVATRIKAITGEDSDDGPVIALNEKVEQRMEAAQKKQKELNNRIEQIRRKATRGSKRELSDKEKAWIDEVHILENKVVGQGEVGNGTRNTKQPWARYEEVKALKEDLLEQIKDISVDEEVATQQNIKVPSEIRKAKMAQIMGLLDRESALVEAAKSRLERLSLS